LSIVQSLTVGAAKTLVQACIASRLDYCNAVLHGITDHLLQRLQSVQNAAARLVTRIGDVFKALNGVAPPHLVDDCNLVSGDIRQLRSAVSTSALPRTRTRLGDSCRFL